LYHTYGLLHDNIDTYTDQPCQNDNDPIDNEPIDAQSLIAMTLTGPEKLIEQEGTSSKCKPTQGHI
jgi:hypothetical protein